MHRHSSRAACLLALLSGCSGGGGTSADSLAAGGTPGAAGSAPQAGAAGSAPLAGAAGSVSSSAGSGGVAGTAGSSAGSAGSSSGTGGGTGGSAGSAGSSGGSAGSGGSEPRPLCSDVTPYEHCEATDFSSEDIFDNPKWQISTWSNDNRTHSADNLWVEDGVLVMRVNGGTTPGAQTVGAEIFTTREDFLYGSFRALAKTSVEPGTVSSPLFYYLNDTSEIDVEILSEQNTDGLVNYTIHENTQGANTHQLFEAGFDPSADFHEYRFDWTPEGVTFYLDGEPTGVVLTGNTPYEPGRIMVNHWTLSDPGWGGGPPAGDAYMLVKSLEFYY